jgi:hypothetical protein
MFGLCSGILVVPESGHGSELCWRQPFCVKTCFVYTLNATDLLAFAKAKDRLGGGGRIDHVHRWDEFRRD